MNQNIGVIKSVDGGGEAAYILSDEQVDALLTAIESSPVVQSNGETSELTNLAAEHLTSIQPLETYPAYENAVSQTVDIEQLERELDAFQSIKQEFDSSTSTESAPEVAQTSDRLSDIVTLLASRASALGSKIASAPASSGDILDASSEKKRESFEKQVASIKSTSMTEKQHASIGKIPTIVVEEAEQHQSWTETSWFRFGAFALISLLILLVVTGAVMWLQRKTAESDAGKKEANSNRTAKENAGKPTLLNDTDDVLATPKLKSFI